MVPQPAASDELPDAIDTEPRHEILTLLCHDEMMPTQICCPREFVFHLKRVETYGHQAMATELVVRP